MPTATIATPQITVHLHKTISRKTVDGQTAVSARYEGKSPFIDLTPFLNDRSSVRTSKSVREPSGGFTITFADKADRSIGDGIGYLSGDALESIYGLVEPMDLIEIRMWSGTGPRPAKLPIVMRGFISGVSRQMGMGQDGRPQRQVVIAGQDYGKIWQIYQVIYLMAYAEGKSLLTNFALWEMFGLQAVNTMPASEFVKKVVEKILNPYLDGFMPKNTEMPRELTTTSGILVKHGVINNSYQQSQGSIYDMLRFHGDVGVWNELYTEDREDGVHVVYRPIPALKLPPGAKTSERKIMDDAPDPVYVEVPDNYMESLSVTRSDANVANFFWVDGSRYDLITDMQRRLAAIPPNDGRVALKDYPNSAMKYYAVRPMYASTQQGGDGIENMTTGQSADELQSNTDKQEGWIDKRRRQMMEMNRDNVVFERGVARVKGGLMRADGKELMKAGDYAKFLTGRLQVEAYVVQIDHEFLPFQAYTTTLTFERGTGFVDRATKGGGLDSPWLAEQARCGALGGAA